MDNQAQDLSFKMNPRSSKSDRWILRYKALKVFFKIREGERDNIMGPYDIWLRKKPIDQWQYNQPWPMKNDTDLWHRITLYFQKRKFWPIRKCTTGRFQWYFRVTLRNTVYPPYYDIVYSNKTIDQWWRSNNFDDHVIT